MHYVVVGFARQCRALGKKALLHMVIQRYHLVAGTMTASPVGFVGHFLTLVMWVVHMKAV